MAVFQRRTRTTRRERPFDLRATAMFFALLAVLVCIVGWLGRAAVHVVERRPVWAVVLLLLIPAVAVACGRGHRRFSAARLARRTGAALEEATATALDALEAERTDPAPEAMAVADAGAAPVSAGAVGAGEGRTGAPVRAGEPDPSRGEADPSRGEAETVVLAGGDTGTLVRAGDGAGTAALPGGEGTTVVFPRDRAGAGDTTGAGGDDMAGAAPTARPVGAPGVPDYDVLSPAEFEQAIAALCARDGCPRVEVVGGAGDLGADVLATTPDGRRVVIQCKRYTDDNKVGSQDLQRFGGTCFTVHEADVAVIVTTSDFTVPATEYAEQCGIVCVSRRELWGWSDGSLAAPWTHGTDAGGEDAGA